MDGELSHGLMEKYMSANTIRTKNTESENSPGPVERFMKVIGLMENSMEKVSIHLQKEKQRKGSGRTDPIFLG